MNTVYYDIVNNGRRVEYHVSADREKVVKAQSLSKGTTSEAPNMWAFVERCETEAKEMELVHAPGPDSIYKS